MNPNDIQKDTNTGSGVEGLRGTETETAEQKQTQSLVWHFFFFPFFFPEVNGEYGLNKWSTEAVCPVIK